MKLEVVRLDSLFLALRGTGLVVGVEEMERCRHVLALWGRDGEKGEAGELSPERWRALFAAVLVKQPAQQKVFEHVFNLWCERAVFETAEALPPPPLPRARPRLLTTLFGLLFLALLVPQLKPRPLEVKPWQPREVKTSPASASTSTAEPAAPKVQTKVWLTVLPREPERPWRGWKEFLLGLCLLAWVGKMAADLEAKPLLPESKLPPRVEGPSRVLLSPPAGDLAILERDEREAIVWGVGKYVSEEMTARLDLKATVKATAKAAGQLELRFEPKKGHREIWIWLDEAAADRQLRRVADEVEAALQRYGLPIERATFRGVPDVLYAEDGRLFRPREIEERRGNAQVAILSDGRLLGRRLEGHASQQLEATFRELGGWPRLSLFLPESAGGALRSLAARHQVEVRRPVELAAFLATSKEKGSGGRRDVELWIAACALAPSAIDERSAEALRRVLKLEAGPFCIADLRRDADVALEGRLEWTGERRQQRVEWLRLAELGEGRIFDRALDHWLGRYASELAARRTDRAFVGTLAEAQLCAEGALLKLLERGEKNAPARSKAIAELFELFESIPALQDYLKKKLGELDTADSEAELLHLDFAWKKLTAVEQFQLIRMGFGGRSSGSRLRRPQRAATFLALGAGLAAGAFLWAFWPQPEAVKQGIEVVDRLAELASFRVVELHESERFFRVEVEVEGEGQRTFKVPSGQKVALVGQGSFTDAWGAEMVRLPAGTFWMGRRDDDPDDPARAFPEVTQGLFDDEKPAHQVTLPSFWIDKYEVTHEQFRRFEPRHRSSWDRELGTDATSRLPVTDVDWRQAGDFCAARGGRLPTEAEWEYAARASTRTPWPSGAEEAILGEYAWYDKNSGGRVQEIGTKKPNPWGLHDLHGNVWEWTASEFVDYRQEAAIDPPPPSSVLRPVVRGGSYWNEARGLRSAYRLRGLPGVRGRRLGFRCVRVSRPVPGLLSSRPLSSPDSASPPGSGQEVSLQSGSHDPEPRGSSTASRQK